MGKLAITGGEPLRKAPFTAWPMGTKLEADALQDVLTSTKWGGQPFPGKHAETFAKKFAETHTAKYAQCVNTGTVAIQAALKAIDIRPGDEVIAPAYTWEGTVGPVLLMNAVPVFVDIDPDTYCLDAKLIERAITPKTKSDPSGASRDALRGHGRNSAHRRQAQPESHRRLRARSRRNVEREGRRLDGRCRRVQLPVQQADHLW